MSVYVGVGSCVCRCVSARVCVGLSLGVCVDV